MVSQGEKPKKWFSVESGKQNLLRGERKMRDDASAKKKVEKRRARRIKEKLSEGAFTEEELHEMLLVAPDILERKRY